MPVPRKKCLNCGTVNTEEAAACHHCRMPGFFRVIEAGAPSPEEAPRANDSCGNCGEPLKAEKGRCSNCQIPLPEQRAAIIRKVS